MELWRYNTEHEDINEGMEYPDNFYYPQDPVLDYVDSDFKVYVNKISWFMSRLPRLEDMI